MPNPSNRFLGWNCAPSPSGPSCWGPSATDNACWSPDFQSGAGSFGPAAPVRATATPTTSTAVVVMEPAPTVVRLDDETQVVVSLPTSIASDEQVLAALQEAAHRIAARLAAHRRAA